MNCYDTQQKLVLHFQFTAETTVKLGYNELGYNELGYIEQNKLTLTHMRMVGSNHFIGVFSRL